MEFQMLIWYQLWWEGISWRICGAKSWVVVNNISRLRFEEKIESTSRQNTAIKYFFVRSQTVFYELKFPRLAI